MDRAHVELDAEGQIVVDIARLYDWPKGEKNEFDEPAAAIYSLVRTDKEIWILNVPIKKRPSR